MGFKTKLKQQILSRNPSTINMSIIRNYLSFILLTNLISTAFSISFQLTPFECTNPDSPICMNGGACFSYFRVTRGYSNLEKCVCEAGFFGPHCEYKNEMASKFVHRLKHLAQRHHKKRISKRSWMEKL